MASEENIDRELDSSNAPNIENSPVIETTAEADDDNNKTTRDISITSEHSETNDGVADDDAGVGQEGQLWNSNRAARNVAREILTALQRLSLDSSMSDLLEASDTVSQFDRYWHNPPQFVAEMELPTGKKELYVIYWENTGRSKLENNPRWYGANFPDELVEAIKLSDGSMHIIFPLGRIGPEWLSAWDQEGEDQVEIVYCLDKQQFWALGDTCFNPSTRENTKRFPVSDIEMTVSVLHGLLSDDIARVEVLSTERYYRLDAFHYNGRILASVRGNVFDIGERREDGSYERVGRVRSSVLSPDRVFVPGQPSPTDSLVA